jgi:hypothetical protein
VLVVPFTLVRNINKSRSDFKWVNERPLNTKLAKMG